ncbi:MAG TPA: HEAT repeat domain-containing protein [Acidimicrobiales bacterium]|nr:HEAT repeat domain-containing protein [Acidimicrobiales bacterium]
MEPEAGRPRRATHQPATVPPGGEGARRRAVLAGHVGDPGAAAEAAAHPDPAVRAAGLGALARLGALSADTVVAALGDGDAGVRRRACTLAGPMLAGPAPTGALVATLVRVLGTDGEWSVAEAAAAALGEAGAMGRGAVVTALAEAARHHPEALCREAAVAALGALAGGDGASGQGERDVALAAVLGGLDDKPAVRRRAAVALAAFEDPRADEGLRRCLADRDWQVRQVAEELLAPGP